MVGETRVGQELDWAAMTKVVELLGAGTPETARKLFRKADIGAGH